MRRILQGFIKWEFLIAHGDAEGKSGRLTVGAEFLIENFVCAFYKFKRCVSVLVFARQNCQQIVSAGIDGNATETCNLVSNRRTVGKACLGEVTKIFIGIQ